MSLENLFKYKQWANSEIIAFGERQIHRLPPEDANFFIRILNHTVVVDSLFISRICGKKEKFESDNTLTTPTIEELKKSAEVCDLWLIEYVKTAKEELDRVISFTFTDGDPGQLSVNEILMHLLTHGSNHRGMASRVLAENGLERPKDTLAKFLHQQEPQRRSI